MNIGLLPITTLVLNDLAMETGQLTEKQSRKNTSQILKSVIFDVLFDKKTGSYEPVFFYLK